MTFHRNGDSAPRTRGHRRSQPSGAKAGDVLQSMTVASSVPASAGRHQAVATTTSGSGHRRGGARAGHRRGGASKQSATKNGNDIPNGNALECQASEPPCAWPAYARSAAEATVEVLAAVSSLYADELKPIGRILRKRVAERILEGSGIDASSVSLDTLPEVDTKQVRAICETSDQLRIEEEDGGDWSAVFVDRAPNFVDVYSPDDCYQEELWFGLRAYCESISGQEMSLPGGRYASAQALMALQLPVLTGFSLGRICHVVQLAISQKKILGYMNGAVVPYARSQAMLKEQCAMYGQRCVGSMNSTGTALPIASIDAARKYVMEILDAGSGEVPLSNVKRIFRSKYQLDLSETSFGHSKLSELLQDVTFQDICTVELKGHGYTVIDVRNNSDCMTDSLVTAMPPSTAPCLEDVPAPCLEDASGRVLLCPDEPLFDDADVLTDTVATVFAPTPTPTATGLSVSNPPRVVLCPDEPLSVDDMDSLMESSPMLFAPTPTPTTIGLAAPHWGSNVLKDSVDGFVASSVQQAFLQYKMPQTPLHGSQQQSHSLLRDIVVKPLDEGESSTDTSSSGGVRRMSRMRSHSDSSSEGSSAETLFGISQLPTKQISHGCATDEMGPSESARPRVNFCPDEPLGFEEGDIFCGRTPGTTPLRSPRMRTPGSAPAATEAKWQPWTPGTLSKEGCVVHNTFLHIAPALPTPIRTGAARRTSSVPKDVGRSVGREPEMQPPVAAPTATHANWQPWTPGALSKEGCFVHNTFLHIAPVLPTPIRTGAARRTSSVPKDVGRSVDREPDVQQPLLQDNCECNRSTCCTAPMPSTCPAVSPEDYSPPHQTLTPNPVYAPYGAVHCHCPLPPPPLPPKFVGQLPPDPLPPQFAPAATPSSSELQFSELFATQPPFTQPSQNQSSKLFATQPPFTQPGSLCRNALQAPLPAAQPGLILRLGEYL